MNSIVAESYKATASLVRNTLADFDGANDYVPNAMKNAANYFWTDMATADVQLEDAVESLKEIKSPFGDWLITLVVPNFERV